MVDHADNTAPKQRGRPFELGKSGNPKGRPKGARNRATILAEALLDHEAEAITRKLVDKALAVRYRSFTPLSRTARGAEERT